MIQIAYIQFDHNKKINEKVENPWPDGEARSRSLTLRFYTHSTRDKQNTVHNKHTRGT